MAKVDGAHIKISIHALREEGDLGVVHVRAQIGISIHALREEGDAVGDVRGQLVQISIHALREEGDRGLRLCTVQMRISIHALREEGDLLFPYQAGFSKYFYPRPPRGGRLHLKERYMQGGEFLSTPSARRATKAARLTSRATRISIHALREEGDPPCCLPSCTDGNFYPRPPRGGRPLRPSSHKRCRYFYPRPPRGGRRRRMRQRWGG